MSNTINAITQEQSISNNNKTRSINEKREKVNKKCIVTLFKV